MFPQSLISILYSPCKRTRNLKEEVLNSLYNAGLITVGAAGVSLASSKLLRENLGVTRTVQNLVKMAVAVGGGTLLVKAIQKKDWLPAEPFKKA